MPTPIYINIKENRRRKRYTIKGGETTSKRRIKDIQKRRFLEYLYDYTTSFIIGEESKRAPGALLSCKGGALMARKSTWDLPPDEGPSQIFVEIEYYTDRAGNRKITAKLSWFSWIVLPTYDSPVLLDKGGTA